MNGMKSRAYPVGSWIDSHYFSKGWLS